VLLLPKGDNKIESCSDESKHKLIIQLESERIGFWGGGRANVEYLVKNALSNWREDMFEGEGI